MYYLQVTEIIKLSGTENGSHRVYTGYFRTLEVLHFFNTF